MAENKNDSDVVKKNNPQKVQKQEQVDSKEQENNEKLNKKREEIKRIASKFWGSGSGYGATHEVDEWPKDPEGNGQKLINHFQSDGIDKELSNNSDYQSCFEKYQKAKGDAGEKNYDYDESSVDFNRVKTTYDAAFFITLDGFPNWFLSTINLNTKNFVMSEFNKTGSLISIVKESEKRLAKKSPENKKEDSKKTNEESEESKEGEKPNDQEQSENKEAQEAKQESVKYALVAAKDEVYEKIQKGFYGNDARESYNKMAEEFAKKGITNKSTLNAEFLKVYTEQLKKYNEEQKNKASETINFDNFVKDGEKDNQNNQTETDVERTSE